MSHGAMAMTLKQKPSLPNGSRLSLHVRRRRGKVGATSRSCWLFFDHEGIVHHEYAPPGQTVTKDYYIEVLRRLRDSVRRKRQQLWASGDWHLHHDNAPAHSSALVQIFLVKHHITQVCQPPLQPRFGSLQLLDFLKTEIAIEREEISDRKRH